MFQPDSPNSVTTSATASGPATDNHQSINQSAIIRFVLRHSTTVLVAQKNVITTVEKMRLQQGFGSVNRRCGPDIVGQMIPQDLVRCCHSKGTITSEPFGTIFTCNIKFKHIPARAKIARSTPI